MKKLFVTLPALALVVALSGSAMAENGAISSATLNEMGLAGIEVMSDKAAMEIRGQGFLTDHSASLAFGLSFASISHEDGVSASAGTIDGFLADGKYMAMGSHLSDAVITKVDSHELWVKGVLAEKTVTTTLLKVAAGGMASSSSF
jgi:hypothetical protein